MVSLIKQVHELYGITMKMVENVEFLRVAYVFNLRFYFHYLSDISIKNTCEYTSIYGNKTFILRFFLLGYIFLGDVKWSRSCLIFNLDDTNSVCKYTLLCIWRLRGCGAIIIKKCCLIKAFIQGCLISVRFETNY